MELEDLVDLVGEHFLSGVSFDKEKGEYGDDGQVINFVLDGTTYTAVEDPDDGYRSCMKYIAVSDRVVKNRFPPVQVLLRMAGGEGGTILEMIDVKTGGIVLRVGTDHCECYYPLWVATFTPENMYINGGKWVNRGEVP